MSHFIRTGAAALNAGRRDTLLHLLNGYRAALELGAPPSEFACQLTCLESLGVSETDLRWLVANGFAQHLLENTKSSLGRRAFQVTANLRFLPASCFVLTASGIDLAERAEVERAAVDPVGSAHLLSARREPGDGRVPQIWVPHYDGGQRTLMVDGQVVKRFRQPAALQELILLAFEEENWPAHLADPLPGGKAIDQKRRLNGAIRNLNAKQERPLLRFHGDGTGTGILWSSCRSAAVVPP
jgi:hypothetical protein